MSVINKMLRDLDKQQQQPNSDYTRFTPPPKSRLLWAAVPLALVAGWYGQSWYMETNATATGIAMNSEAIPQTEPKSAVVAQEQSVAPAVAEPAPAQATAAVATDGVAQLQPLAKPPVAEQSVALTAVTETTVAQHENLSLADIPTNEVQVSEFDQSAEFSAESERILDTEWEPEPTVAAKPRSLAIEKVQLSPQQQQEVLKNKALKAESAGNLPQAIAIWQQIRQLQPMQSEAYLQLSRLLQMQRNDPAAVQILEQASASGVQDPKLAMALAALAVKQQNWTQALSYLEGEPDIFQHIDFYALKAAALQKTSQHTQAVQVFQQLVRQQPGQARWWLGMALSYDALLQKEQALLAYRQVAANGFGLSAESLDYVKKRIAALE